jgi:hypothetical protein
VNFRLKKLINQLARILNKILNYSALQIPFQTQFMKKYTCVIFILFQFPLLGFAKVGDIAETKITSVTQGAPILIALNSKFSDTRSRLTRRFFVEHFTHADLVMPGCMTPLNAHLYGLQSIW